MDEAEFKRRTRQLGLDIIELVGKLPPTSAGKVLGHQILRSACSVGANYRAACRAKSKAHMISKLGDVEEEADETLHWLEMIREARLAETKDLAKLMQETESILRMVVASIKTLKRRPE
jgi:four helix bundle protein